MHCRFTSGPKSSARNPSDDGSMVYFYQIRIVHPLQIHIRSQVICKEPL